jgi:hypothetical protein
LQGIEKATGVDIATKIIKHIEKGVKKQREKRERKAGIVPPAQP